MRGYGHVIRQGVKTTRQLAPLNVAGGWAHSDLGRDRFAVQTHREDKFLWVFGQLQVAL